jgi:hypothetical protein
MCAQTVNVKLNCLLLHQEELKRCVLILIVRIINFILGSLLSKIPLDPKIQALIDQGKSIFEEYK